MPASVDVVVRGLDGTTTISGHLAHSLNTSFGLSVHSSVADTYCAECGDTDAKAATLPHGLAGIDGTTCGTTAASFFSSSIAPGRIGTDAVTTLLDEDLYHAELVVSFRDRPSPLIMIVGTGRVSQNEVIDR